VNASQALRGEPAEQTQPRHATVGVNIQACLGNRSVVVEQEPVPGVGLLLGIRQQLEPLAVTVATGQPRGTGALPMKYDVSNSANVSTPWPAKRVGANPATPAGLPALVDLTLMFERGRTVFGGTGFDQVFFSANRSSFAHNTAPPARRAARSGSDRKCGPVDGLLTRESLCGHQLS
jgi:hypothetical protein